LDMPRRVATRREWKPRGASAGASNLTRRGAGVFPFLASGGVVAPAGEVVPAPGGAAQVGAGRVRLAGAPRRAAGGGTGLGVGACGLAGAGGWATSAAGASRSSGQAR